MLSKMDGPGIVVVGAQWGDEGKGRIVDSMAAFCDVVVRFQGGNNAGHSLHIGDMSLVLHLIPCGIVRSDKVCVIGNGVVIDPDVLDAEMQQIKQAGIKISPQNLKISHHAHIIFPFHKSLDASRENVPLSKIGTTKRGIGPCYENKVARFGICAKDLLMKDILLRKLLALAQSVAPLADEKVRGQLVDLGLRWGEMLRPYLCDVGEFLHESFRQGKKVLFEGAQGALLDVDHGTYPFVTSSNCVAAQASIGSGIGMGLLKDVLLVSKAYCTRVGEGPFFTEGTSAEQEVMRARGFEFGATTGRPRRCGWLDLPALKYAARINGATGLILTKVDILASIGMGVKVCVSYDGGKKTSLTFTQAMEMADAGQKITPNYLDLGLVTAMPSFIEKIADLPDPLKKLCTLLERELQIPIRGLSYGKKRGDEFFVG